jgi:hypothetical protein
MVNSTDPSVTNQPQKEIVENIGPSSLWMINTASLSPRKAPHFGATV